MSASGGWLSPVGLAALGYCAAVIVFLVAVGDDYQQLPQWKRTAYALMCAPALLIGLGLGYGLVVWAWLHALPWLILSLPVIVPVGWLYERRATRLRR